MHVHVHVLCTHTCTHTHTHTHTHFISISCLPHSYPGCCVSRSHPMVYPCRDSQTVASAFIADIHARVPTVCGEPVKFGSTALTPFADLHTASNSSPHPNARPAASTQSSLGLPGIRQVPAAARFPTATAPSRPPLSSVQATRSNACRQSAQCVPSLNAISRPDPAKAGVLPGSSIQTTSMMMPDRGGMQQAARGPAVPVFKPRFSSLPPSSSQQPTTGAQEARHVPLMPSFKPQLPPTSCGQSATNAGSKQAYSKETGPRSTSQAHKSSAVVPPPAKRLCLPSRTLQVTSRSTTPSLPSTSATGSAGVPPLLPNVMFSSTPAQSSQQTVPDISGPWPHQDSLMEAAAGIGPVCKKLTTPTLKPPNVSYKLRI